MLAPSTLQICPSCHSETRRLIFCAINRCLVCAESCALTDADLFLLELVQPQSVSTRGGIGKAANEAGDEVLRICTLMEEKGKRK